MFKGRSKALFLGAIIGTLYSIYIINYFTGVNISSNGTAEQVGGALATALVLPHLICICLATLFNWLGFAFKKTGFALTGAILYCVGAILFLIYAIFCIPSIILGFIGYSKQKKINKLIRSE